MTPDELTGAPTSILEFLDEVLEPVVNLAPGVSAQAFPELDGLQLVADR